MTFAFTPDQPSFLGGASMSAGEETMGHAVNSVRKGIMIMYIEDQYFN